MSGEIIQRDAFHQANASVLVGSTNTVVIQPVNLLRYDKKAFTVKNLGPNTFQTAKVQATVIEQTDTQGRSIGLASSTDADWEDIDNTTLVGLLANQIKSVQIKDDSRKWWRVVAACNGTTSGAIGHVTAGSP